MIPCILLVLLHEHTVALILIILTQSQACQCTKKGVIIVFLLSIIKISDTSLNNNVPDHHHFLARLLRSSLLFVGIVDWEDRVLLEQTAIGSQTIQVAAGASHAIRKPKLACLETALVALLIGTAFQLLVLSLDLVLSVFAAPRNWSSTFSFLNLVVVLPLEAWLGFKGQLDGTATFN